MLVRPISLLLAIAASSSAALGQSTPPPPSTLEFFHPTAREHSVSASCSGGGTAAVAWAFDGTRASLRSFTFGGSSLPPAQLTQMQAWMSEIGGDVLIDLECGGNSASIRVINAQFAGTARARMIRIHLTGGALSEFARYNF